MYIGTVMWNGRYRTIEVDEADTDPITGMGLLRGTVCAWMWSKMGRSGLRNWRSSAAWEAGGIVHSKIGIAGVAAKI
ncbi:MAG: hypothetical protein OXO50_09325 [Caldilineaceae bacterium]|nr:hypothetical protein [Caldilineaceae bacterium]